MTLKDFMEINLLACHSGVKRLSARGQIDNRLVLIKQPVDAGNEQVIFRLEREFHVSTQLGSEFLPKPLGIRYWNGNPLFVYKYPEGELLSEMMSRGPLPLPFILEILLVLCKLLGPVHKAGMVCKAIHPETLVISMEALRPRVVYLGFDSGLFFPKEHVTSCCQLPAAGLAYLSPEQTGRLDLLSDFRTDFYSLGVLLYEMLTGSLPFPDKDPMEIVHCILAKTPVPPHQLNPDLPRALSEITIRLLAKRPDERYQRLAAITHDLKRCLTQVADGGKVPAFEIGKKDGPNGLILTDKLVGREKELGILTGLWNRRNPTTSDLVWIMGDSGSGKTALVNGFKQRLNRESGIWFSVKCQPEWVGQPLCLIQALLRSWIAHMLCQPDPIVSRVRTSILENMGDPLHLLVKIIPELNLLVELPSSMEADEIPYNSRMVEFSILGLMEFLFHLQGQAIFVIDDCHWADPLSIQLIVTSMKQKKIGGILLLAAFREVAPHTREYVSTLSSAGDAQGLEKTVLEVGPLPRKRIEDLFMEWLHSSRNRVKPLVDLCLAASDKTILSLVQCIQGLYNQRLIWFNPDHGRWEWQMSDLFQSFAKRGEINWALQAIQDLPEDGRTLLKQAACMGPVFDIGLLAAISGQSHHQVFQLLGQSIQTGLIIPCQTGEILKKIKSSPPSTMAQFEFLHDKVREIFYGLMPAPEKQACHLSIARELAKPGRKRRQGLNYFLLANHLNQSEALILEAEDQITVAKINLSAGKEALKKTSFHAAFNYFFQARKSLGPHGWDRSYALTMEIHLNLMGSAGMVNRLDVVELILDEIKTKAVEPIHLARMYKILGRRFLSEIQPKKAVDAVRKAMSALGFDFPPTPDAGDVRSELRSLEAECARKKYFADITDLKMTDPDALYFLSFCSEGAFSGLVYDAYLPSLYFIQCAWLSLKKGVAPTTASALMFCAKLMSLTTKNPRAGDTLGNVARKLMEIQIQNGELSMENRAIQVYHEIQSMETGAPLAEQSARLKKVYASLSGTGRLANTFVIFMASCFLDFTRGRSLQAIVDELKAVKRKIKDWGPSSFNYSINHLLEVLACLRGAKNEKFPSGTNHVRQFDPIIRTSFYQRYLAYSSGNFKGALLPDGLCWVNEFQHLFWPEIADSLLYDSLARLALMPESSREVQHRYQEKVSAHLGFIASLAEAHPHIYQHKLYLLSAEKARVEGDIVQAMNDYDRSIDLARENRFIRDLALANELAARFWFANGKPDFAAIYGTAAKAAYDRWGAAGKSRQLESEYPDVFPRAAGTREAAPPNTSGQVDGEEVDFVDFAAIIKTAQAFSREHSLELLVEEVLSTVIRSAGAVRGTLLWLNEGRLQVQANGCNGPDGLAFQGQAEFDPDAVREILPWQAVLYSFRSGKMVVARNAGTDERFRTDPYLLNQKNLSFLCLPLVYNSDVLGLIYLENDITSGVFTRARIRVLELIIMQISISLANAQYIDTIKKEIAFRREAEEKLAEEKENLAITLASIGDGVIATDTNGVIRLINQTAKKFTAWSNHQAIGQSLTDVYQVVDESTGRSLPDPVEKVLATGQTFTHGTPVILLSKEGKKQVITHSGAPVFDKSGKIRGVALVFQDITEKRRMETQLLEAQKMEAIGTLSGGIAHDFNNILGGILGCIGMMAQSLAVDAEEQKWLSRASTACNRAKILVRQFLDICRPHEEEVQLFAIDHILKELVKLLRAFIPSTIKIDLRLGMEESWIRADAGRFHQMMMNLCTNASQSMGDSGGCLDIIVERGFPPDFGTTGTGPSTPGESPGETPYIKIKVRDTGCGIDPAILPRIFDPYFTTKEKGVGTGMGLAVVQSIVKNFGGTLIVQSQLGKGTCFVLFLPQSSPGQEPGQRRPHLPLGGHEQILLVEDNALLVSASDKALSQLGYNVKSTQSPQEALILFSTEPDRFDLVITDMTMPEMTGDQLAGALRKIRPGIPIIICSGFMNKFSPEDIKEMDVQAVVHKPYDTEELGSTVRSVLDGADE